MNGVLANLLRACRADPDDDAARLVLADWLEEQGDPRGELVRVQVERDRPGTAPERQAALARREAQLLRLHGWDWLRPLGAVVDERFRRGFLSVVLDAGEAGYTSAASANDAWAWVDEVEVQNAPSMAEVLADPGLRGATRFHFSEPRDAYNRPREEVPPAADIVEALRARYNRLWDEAYADLARLPENGRLTSLEVYNSHCGSGGLVTLLTSPHLNRLRRLVLDFTQVTPEGLAALATLDHPALTTLRLFGAHLGAAGGNILASSPLLARLRRLELIVTHLGTEGFLAVIRSPHLARLEHLHLSSERMTVGGVRALGQLPGLRSLALRECGLKMPAARALAAAPWPGGLERLDLYRNHLDDVGVAALTSAPWLAGLRELNLGNNRLRTGAVKGLAGSGIANLTHLDLSSNGLGTEEFQALAPFLARQKLVSLNLGSTYPRAEGLRHLADCPGLDCLVELDLGMRIGEANGARVLAAAPWLGGLVRFNLFATRFGPDGLEPLLASGRLGLVTDLNLCLCELGDQGARLLADWPGLAGLLRLDLHSNEITDEGAAALAASPYLSPGLHLDLGNNRQGDASNARLRERLGARLNLVRHGR
jgi:uncharacterized protein (TIGR02996 family)